MCLGIPGEIVAGAESGRPGRVRFGTLVKDVALDLLPAAKVGDWVVVHAGFAIAVVDEAEARRTLADLAAIGAVPPGTTR